ncbi:hypothetical protein JW948_03800 [bacterium]|nr:hypothetical protein [bacterium]
MTEGLKRIMTILTIILIISLAVVSYCGAFQGSTYERDARSMAVQGMGQDMVDLFLVVPLLLVTWLLVLKGSRSALSLFSGLLMYILYSYFIYTFGVHFNDLFLLYCLILGTSLYAFIITVVEMNRTGMQDRIPGSTTLRTVAVFFLVIAAMFALLWLKDIVPAVLNHSVPVSVSDYQLPVNAVHVLDLSIFLPGLAITAVLLLKNYRLGFILAPVFLVFLVLMAVALIGMVVMMKNEGLNEDISPAVIFSIISVIGIVLLVKYLNSMRKRTG